MSEDKNNEKSPNPLRVEKNNHFIAGVGLFFVLITLVMALMQTILTPFFSGFFSQSIGGMGLK